MSTDDHDEPCPCLACVDLRASMALYNQMIDVVKGQKFNVQMSSLTALVATRLMGQAGSYEQLQDVYRFFCTALRNRIDESMKPADGEKVQ